MHRAKGTMYRALIRKKGFKTITKVFDRKSKAIEFAQQIEGDRRKHLSYSNSVSLKLTLSEIIDLYLSFNYKNTRPQEQKYKLNFWKAEIGCKLIIDITKTDIAKALSSLPSNLSNATINRYKAAISVVFTYACQHHDLIINPVTLIPSLAENNQRTRYLSDSERKRLFDACRDSKWKKLYLITLMAITTGARKGELINLKWSNINFKQQTAYISITKNGEPKVLPLTDDVISELNKFKHQESQLIFNSEIKINKSYVFFKPWKLALKQASIQDFRFHDLRHTTASYLAHNGASLLEIADVLGHKQIQMTKRYSHLCITHKQKLINSVMSNI
jgi:integrase